MQLFVYPAIFFNEEDDSKITVVFPDLDVYTYANTIEEAYLLAKDLLRQCLTYAFKYDLDYNLPSTIESAREKIYSKEQTVMLVDAAVQVEKLEAK